MAANVDTTRVIDELEALLVSGNEPTRCAEAMAILWRWQWDGDLNDMSRRRAGRLVRQYQSHWMSGGYAGEKTTADYVDFSGYACSRNEIASSRVESSPSSWRSSTAPRISAKSGPLG